MSENKKKLDVLVSFVKFRRFYFFCLYRKMCMINKLVNFHQSQNDLSQVIDFAGFFETGRKYNNKSVCFKNLFSKLFFMTATLSNDSF